MLCKKVVVVGDGACGKTALLCKFVKNEFFVDYAVSVFEACAEEVDGVKLELNDTAGQEDYDQLRKFSYTNVDVVCLCFSIDYPSSLENVIARWMPELKMYCPKAPVILIGNKSDLRFDSKTIERLNKVRMSPIPTDEGMNTAKKIGAKRYMECSSKTGEGVREIFEMAAAITRSQDKVEIIADDGHCCSSCTIL